MSKNKTALFLIELNAQTEDEKIKISPVGLSTGVDGRVFNIDAQAVVDKTKSYGVDVVLNVNHGYDDHKEKAAGWFDVNSLEVREDGIYASLNTTDIGKALIEKKYFRYLSPEYHISWNGDIREVRDIAGVGLVNRPNLLDESLNQIEEPDEAPKPEQNTDTTEENQVSKEVEPTQKELELQKQLEAQTAKNKQLEEDAKTAKIETAINAGELLPNKREFAMNLQGTQLDEFLSINKEDAKHLGASTKPDDNNTATLSDEDKEVNRQLGLGEDDDN